MDNENIQIISVAFLTPQIFYLFRWWNAGKGWEKLLRNFAYALFVGLLNWATLFMLAEFYAAHFLVQMLISFVGSLFMLTSDWYGPFIEGKNIFAPDDKE